MLADWTVDRSVEMMGKMMAGKMVATLAAWKVANLAETMVVKLVEC